MNLEELLGIKVSALLGGLVGGLISLTYEEKISFGRAVLLILCGGFTSGYAFVLANDYWQLKHSYSGIFGFGIGLISMRIVDLIILASQHALEISKRIFLVVQKNPSLIFSYSKLIKVIKDGGLSSTDNGNTRNSVPNLDATRKGRKKTSKKI